MQIVLSSIPMRDVLHFLGWRGAPVEPLLLEQLQALADRVIDRIHPRVVIRRFPLYEDGSLKGTSFLPQGDDMKALLHACTEAVLMAATLGVQSERELLKEQARSRADAVLLDAVLNAAIEAVCDEQEEILRTELAAQGLYLTDRFSPGYGDMPLAQSKEICEVLMTGKTIGLTVSHNGILIPRKSVTAIMGASRSPVSRREQGCAVCSMREACAFSRR